MSLENAMTHSKYNERHRALLDELERKYLASLPLSERGSWLTVQGGAYKSKDEITLLV